MPHVHGRATDRRRLKIALSIGLALLVVEVVGGIAANSLAVLADAGHVLTDVTGIGLSLTAMWIAGRPATDGRTFGYYRAEILAAVANAVLLVGVAAFVLVSAIGRLDDPPEVQGSLMFVLGVVGLVANGASAMLLRRSQAGSLNVRGAYLEVLGDLVGSVAVIAAAVVLALTGWRAADAVASIIVALLIVPRTVGLLREAIDVLLEATPRGMRLEDVRAHIIDADGVADVHDLHAWTITSGLPVISAHVVLSPGAEPARVLDELCACLAGDFDVEHSTFQLETVDRRRLETTAHL
jgi:cobalt-zinc-cadmium efflux system protein